MKKLFTLLSLVFLLIISLSTPALAAGPMSGLGDLILLFLSIPALITLGADLLCTILIMSFGDKVGVITTIFVVNIVLCFIVIVILIAFANRNFMPVLVLTSVALLWQIINIILCVRIMFFKKKTPAPKVEKTPR